MGLAVSSMLIEGATRVADAIRVDMTRLLTAEMVKDLHVTKAIEIL